MIINEPRVPGYVAADEQGGDYLVCEYQRS
jgi:hypothetical protein